MGDTMNSISEVIARRRKALGMTQKELAEKLNISDKTLSRWETGKQIPDALTLKQIANVLELTISEIYGEEAEEIPQALEVSQKKYSRKKICSIVAGMIAVVAVALILFVSIGNLRLTAKVSYKVKDVPMYALTRYDHTVLNWMKQCNEQGDEVGWVSSMNRDPETGDAVAHYLFYLPHGYEETEVNLRYRHGWKANVLTLDFENTTQTMDDSYYLCYVKIPWEDNVIALEISLDGHEIKNNGPNTVSNFVELCGVLFEE